MDDRHFTPEQWAKINAVREDFYLFCQNNLWITTKEQSLVRLEPNRIQRQIVAYVLECLMAGIPIRLIILKARQEGVSTIIEALVYWWTSTHKHVRSKITAHDTDASENLYAMFKRYYDHSHVLFKPATKYVTKNNLTFDVTDEDKDKARKQNRPVPGLDSSISVDTAGSTEAGRSETNHWFHGSEVSAWKSGEKLTAALMQTVPMKPNTFMALESTANGMGDYFHKTWVLSKAGKSAFKPFFFGWHEHEEYQIPCDKLPHKTQEEKDLQRAYKLTDSQLNWRREKMKEFAGDPARFAQEYPINDVEAFLASGRPRFNLLKLFTKEPQAYEPGTFELLEEKEKIRPIPVVNAPLKIWHQPQTGHQYVIGADVAEGISQDSSVATVIDKATCTTVARWRGDIEPSEFGEVLEQLGRYYNNALIGCEINNHGLTTVQRLRDLRYANLYRRETGMDTRFETQTSFLGWQTTRKTKPVMINALSEAINLDKFTDYDQEFFEEAKAYIVEDNGRTNAQEGAHDDVVISTAIALQMFEWTDVHLKRKDHKSTLPSHYQKMRQRNRQLYKR